MAMANNSAVSQSMGRRELAPSWFDSCFLWTQVRTTYDIAGRPRSRVFGPCVWPWLSVVPWTLGGRRVVCLWLLAAERVLGGCGGVPCAPDILLWSRRSAGAV
eukprot:8780322-Alexandrium_andersonii.AAC.1